MSNVPLTIRAHSRFRRVLALALPLMGVMLSQNLIGVIDTIMAGRFGDAALSAVGFSSVLFAMLTAFFNGLDAATQASVARRIGEGDPAGAVSTLKSAIGYAFASGTLVCFIGYLLVPLVVMTALPNDASIHIALAYVGMRLPMLSFVGMSYAFSAYWNGTGQPKWSFAATLVLLVSNTLLNYGLIFGHLGLPALGAAGAGLASTFASLVALAFHILVARKQLGNIGLAGTWLDRDRLLTIVRASVPVSFQQMFVYLGFSGTMLIIARLGVRELAAANVIYVILSLQSLPIVGMGVAAATLVGQSLGRGNASCASAWGWVCARYGATTMAIFSTLVILFPHAALALFVQSRQTVDVATLPLQILAVGLSIDTYTKVLNFSLRGAGAMKLAAAIPFTMQWPLGLPVYWYLGVHLGYGLVGITAYSALAYAVEALITSFVWTGRWWLSAT